jgi:cellulose synthase/poly-beta-1,6-N-acetylglucosamine synthase-like glycosyltransferase
MTLVVTAVMWAIGLALLGAVAVLLLQLLANLLPAGSDAGPHSVVPSHVVLMPAHDEATIIREMVAATRAQLPSEGRLLVIADNCTDDTAERAREAGAEVLERHDPQLRGKGHALAYGIDALRSAPPSVVLVVDADCRTHSGAFATLATEADRLQRPVQGMYAMVPPSGAGLKQRIAAFAWDFRARVRAEGYRRIGLPCQLMGSGMAFPWPLLDRVSFATGHIVEDLKLGLEFAEQRAAPVFRPRAIVESTFPDNEQGAQSQRKRWEHGHLAMIATSAPGLFWKSLSRSNMALLAMTIDMCVPPLALLGLLLVANSIGAGLLAWLGVIPATVGVLALWSTVLFAAIVLAGWWMVGRRWVSLGELAAIPWYMAKKVPLYLGFLTKRQTGWVRTKRD